MRLVYTKTQKEVKVGDTVAVSGEAMKVTYFRKPTSAASSGKVSVSSIGFPDREYYVSVIGAEWIDREDRYAVQNGQCVYCGRDYREEEMPDGVCPADDCPSNCEYS